MEPQRSDSFRFHQGDLIPLFNCRGLILRTFPIINKQTIPFTLFFCFFQSLQQIFTARERAIAQEKAKADYFHKKVRLRKILLGGSVADP
jgi:hypothetical protein